MYLLIFFNILFLNLNISNGNWDNDFSFLDIYIQNLTKILVDFEDYSNGDDRDISEIFNLLSCDESYQPSMELLAEDNDDNFVNQYLDDIHSGKDFERIDKVLQVFK